MTDTRLVEELKEQYALEDDPQRAEMIKSKIDVLRSMDSSTT